MRRNRASTSSEVQESIVQKEKCKLVLEMHATDFHCCTKDTGVEASCHLDTDLCFLDDIGELSHPQEAVLRRQQKEAVPTVE